MADQEIIDLGWEKYLAELDEKLSYVDVGVIASDGAKKAIDKDGKDTGITLVEKASINEFGTDKIPSRPFIRQTFDENESVLGKLVSDKEDEILRGKTTRRDALTMIGQAHQNQVQRAIATSGKFEANAGVTIKRKGSAQPLIDTGQLRQSINFEVG